MDTNAVSGDYRTWKPAFTWEYLVKCFSLLSILVVTLSILVKVIELPSPNSLVQEKFQRTRNFLVCIISPTPLPSHSVLIGLEYGLDI